MENTQIDQSSKIQSLGYASFIYSISKSCFLGMASYLIFNMSNIDSYISAILGTIIGLIPLGIFLFTVNHSENKDVLALNTTLFGKPIGITLNIILTLTFFVIAIIMLYNVSEFATSQFLPDTNINYVRILILLPIIYASSKNINVIVKISQVIMFINLGFFIVSCFGLLSEWHLDNIFPIMKDGITPSLKSMIIYAIFSTFPMFLMTIIPQSVVQQDKHKNKKVIFVYLLFNFVIIMIIFNVIFVLGGELLPIYRYPEFTALKKFQLFEIIERVENTLSLQFVFTASMFLILSFHFILEAIKKFIKNEKFIKVFPALLGIVVLIISNFTFKDSTQFKTFLERFLPWIIVIGVFVPMFITFLGTFFKNLKNKKMAAQNSTS